MSYCPKCGSKIEDESKGCRICMGNVPLDNSQDEMSAILKVVIVAMVIFTNVLGGIVGIIGGIILMKHSSESYRHFGKTLVIVSVAMLVIGILCCLVYGFFYVGLLGIGMCY